MKSSLNKIPGSQLEILAEFSVEEFNGFCDKAVLLLSEGIKIDGFRQGKAPKEMAEKRLGEEKILTQAAEIAVQECYEKIVKENNIEPISRPEITVKKLAKSNPFVFSVKIAVMPDVVLPDYKKIAGEVKKKDVNVSDKEVEDSLKWLQKSRAKFTAKISPAEKGDFIEIEYWLSGLKDFPGSNNQKDNFILGEGGLFPGLEDSLIGMTAGGEKEGIKISIPENHSLAKFGKEVTIRVRIISLQKAEFPEISDQFAISLGNFKDLLALKDDLKKGILSEKNQEEKTRLRSEIIEKISNASDCEMPAPLVDGQQKKMLERMKIDIQNSLKMSYEDYLKNTGKTEKEILTAILPQAEKSVKNSLVLREIGKKENITVTEKEIEEEVNRALKRYPNREEFEKNVGLDKMIEYAREYLWTEKTFKTIENNNI
jgi:trigger factor